MARISANVALVEDDASVRKAIVRLLTVAGFQTIAFDSAEAFLDSSETTKQQGCVVIDINLPGLSGFELQERMCAPAGKPLRTFAPAVRIERPRKISAKWRD